MRTEDNITLTRTNHGTPMGDLFLFRQRLPIRNMGHQRYAEISLLLSKEVQHFRNSLLGSPTRNQTVEIDWAINPRGNPACRT